MTSAVSVRIHPSRFPAAIEAALHESLRTRHLHPQFLYDTPKRAQLWQRVHEAYSPARTDPSCRQLYTAAAAAAAQAMEGAPGVSVMALGCGTGHKDAQLLQRLLPTGPQRIAYVPLDVSLDLVLLAREAALAVGLPAAACHPLVMDLTAAPDWRAALSPRIVPAHRRVVTFFGLLPNFSPGAALDRLAGLLRPNDLLLVSTHLAPGPDYRAGVEKTVPLYDNAPTREWVLTALLDLGVERADGHLLFRVADCPAGSGLCRYEFVFEFLRARLMELGGHRWAFAPGDRFLLFFSYRHTAGWVADTLGPRGITLLQSWVTPSGDEGVFLCRRPARGVSPHFLHSSVKSED